MSPRCPKPCGRLATAGVFVSIGVIQFIAGLILLKSKYVYLLAAPNMWTAVSNFSVGCLLGISSGVWRNTRKRTFKHTTRRNILAALVGSVVLMNSTTAIILILGEGNALLSIRLESNGRNSSSALASDILAYSYATSVCCPVVCIVVALTFLSGIWFRVRDKGEKVPEIRSILKKRQYE